MIGYHRKEDVEGDQQRPGTMASGERCRKGISRKETGKIGGDGDMEPEGEISLYRTGTIIIITKYIIYFRGSQVYEM